MCGEHGIPVALVTGDATACAQAREINAACADAAELVPGTARRGGLTCAYRAPDAATMLQVIQAWTILAASTLV